MPQAIGSFKQIKLNEGNNYLGYVFLRKTPKTAAFKLTPFYRVFEKIKA
jgi:hypothetical protein